MSSIAKTIEVVPQSLYFSYFSNQVHQSSPSI
jgi:hypothetical protein